MGKTQVCCLNLERETVNQLEEEGFHTYNGSLGYLTKLDYSYSSRINCLTRHNFPKNLHEFEVIIIDLTNELTIAYDPEHHEIKNSKSRKTAYIRCDPPQNIFDPRPLTIKFLLNDLFGYTASEKLILVFCGLEDEIEYLLDISGDLTRKKHTSYSSLEGTPNRKNLHGFKTLISDEGEEIFDFLRKYQNEISYDIIFDLPRQREGGDYILHPDYKPLISTIEGQIVSFYRKTNNFGLFYFPNILNKAKFLKEFLTQIAPIYHPTLFPEIVKNKWLDDAKYFLPNHSQLLNELKNIEKEYELKIEGKKQDIELNKVKYSFLTSLLTEAGDELVGNVIIFFQWLGFENVVNADELKDRKIKEEDIQISTDEGLIIIEVKGLGGTSKDSDCGQIGKVKYRRARERGTFDVFAHYIVNHQRHLPATERINPPFSEHQIADAENDERGLITTWQLFNLFFAVEDGIITKEQARACFHQNGYIDFTPENMLKLGKPKELFKSNLVAVIDLDNQPLNEGDYLMVREKEKFTKVKIKSIQMQDQEVKSCNTGEVGLMLDKPIGKSSVLYKYSPEA